MLYRFYYYKNETIAPDKLDLQTAQQRYRESSFVVVDDVFIGCDKQFNISDAGNIYLHIWKLSSGNKIAMVQLKDHIDRFESFLKSSVTDKKEVDSLTSQVKLFSVSDDLSKILIVMYNDVGSQINIFNLKTMNVTHLVAQVPYRINECHMYTDKLCVTRGANDTEVSIFTLSPGNSNHLQERLLKTLMSDRQSPVFKNSKVISSNMNSVSLVDLNDDSLQEIKVNVSNNFKFLSFIEPNLLMVFQPQGLVDPSAVQVINIKDNSTLCSWIKPDIYFSAPPPNNYYSHLIYPTKIGLQFGEKLRLFIT